MAHKLIPNFLIYVLIMHYVWERFMGYWLYKFIYNYPYCLWEQLSILSLVESIENFKYSNWIFYQSALCSNIIFFKDNYILNYRSFNGLEEKKQAFSFNFSANQIIINTVLLYVFKNMNKLQEKELRRNRKKKRYKKSNTTFSKIKTFRLNQHVRLFTTKIISFF